MLYKFRIQQLASNCDEAQTRDRLAGIHGNSFFRPLAGKTYRSLRRGTLGIAWNARRFNLNNVLRAVVLYTAAASIIELDRVVMKYAGDKYRLAGLNLDGQKSVANRYGPRWFMEPDATNHGHVGTRYDQFHSRRTRNTRSWTDQIPLQGLFGDTENPWRSSTHPEARYESSIRTAVYESAHVGTRIVWSTINVTVWLVQGQYRTDESRRVRSNTDVLWFAGYIRKSLSGQYRDVFELAKLITGAVPPSP